MRISQDRLIDHVFSRHGLLRQYLGDFEERPSQVEMAREILSSYSEEKIALIEAGTGVGKSLAYLVPAVFWALKAQEKTVISTHTIALQEQLLFKDIPFLLKVLGVDLKVCLLKGMGNYLCLRKLQEQPLPATEETHELSCLNAWAKTTQEGSKSEISFPLSSGTWEKVAAESDACSHVHCPHYKECFYFKAKKQAQEAQLIIVNHHLLFSDLAARRRPDFKEEKAVLPPFARVVLDEAHTVEEVALEIFSLSVDRHGLVRLLGKMLSDLHPERSRLFLIKQLLAGQSPEEIFHLLEVSLPEYKRETISLLEEAFHALEQFLRAHAPQGREEWELRLRLIPSIASSKEWRLGPAPLFTRLSDRLRHLALQLALLEKRLEDKSAKIEKLKGHLLDLHALAVRIEEKADLLSEFFSEKQEETQVKWVEWKQMRHFSNLTVCQATLDIATLLQEHLFRRMRTTTLCSATLTTGGDFSFTKQRLGLAERLTEHVFASPFDYRASCLFLVPTDCPAPADPTFTDYVSSQILSSVTASRGSAFILFTSYEMLQQCHRRLVDVITFPVLKQGELPRHQLIEKFKAKEGNVLFATDSFWEGVDVPGEALRCVILVKLPFKVPGDPLTAAFLEKLAKEGKNPFYDHSVPQAVIKFKQGFGRLIRKQKDRGCVVCLDHRLVTKSYGKQFLKSLPDCQTFFGPSLELAAEMEKFYSTDALKTAQSLHKVIHIV